MERLQLVLSGVEQALRPIHSHPSMPPQASAARATATLDGPAWLHAVRQQLPRLMEALGAEQTDADDHSLAARSHRLAAERNRLLRRLQQLAPALTDGCVSGVAGGIAADHEQLRRMLLRLMHDIAHHHQRVNDLVYDAGWRDVGGSE